jgi:hypothetical protein
MQRAGTGTALIAIFGVIAAPVFVGKLVDYLGGPGFAAGAIVLFALIVGLVVWGLADAVISHRYQRRMFYERLGSPRYCAHAGPPDGAGLVAGVLLLIPANLITLFAFAVAFDVPRDGELIWVTGGLTIMALTVQWIAGRFLSDYFLQRAAWHEALGYREALGVWKDLPGARRS